MEKTWFETQFAKALKAGQKRDYKKAIVILEELASQVDAGQGENADGVFHPEVYIYLARAWHAEKMYARAASCARSFIGFCPESGSGWFFLGRSYLADGQADRAIHALKKSVDLNPESVDARALFGMALLKGRKPLLARAVFEEALTLAPDDPRLNQGYLNSLFIVAVRTFRRGDAETARQLLTFLINNDIDGVVPRLYLAHALKQLGYLTESLGQYEAATEFAPDDPALRWYQVAVLLEMGDPQTATALMAELGETPEQGQVSPRMVTMQIIRNHLDKSEWANAAQAARAWLGKEEGDAQAHALMAEALRNLGNRDAAMNHFKRALELDRENPAPWYGIILLLVEASDWQALKPVLERAAQAGCDAATVDYYRVLARANLDEDPERILPGIQEQVRVHGAVPELVVALARTYFRIGLPDLATGWYEKALSLDGENESAWLGFIACCEELGPPEKLRKAYEDYLVRWADNPAIRRDLIKLLAASEVWEAAADQIEELTRFVNDSSSERQLALYRRKAGQFRSAAFLYRAMLRKKPDDRNLLANLVFCLDRMGETESAVKLMHEANRTFKADAESLLIEGRLLERAGNFNAALEVFRLVVDKFPKDVRGWEEVSHVYTRQGVPEMAAVFAEKAREVSRKKR